MPRDKLIQVRRGTATEWTTANPTLAIGEIGYETDTGKGKIGNGTQDWVSLGYVTAWGSGGGGGGVTSVNGQTGVVVLDADDIDDTSTTNKFATASELSKLAGIEAGAEVNTVDSVNSQTGVVVLDADDIDDSATTNKFVTASDLTTLSNTSGTNTGDQDLSGLVPYTGASGNVTLGTNTITTAAVLANSSAGASLKTSGGSDVVVWGQGGGVNGTLYGGWNYDNATADTLAYFGPSKTISSVTLGSGLSLSSGTLSATGSASSSDMPIIRLNSSAAQSANSASDIAIEWNNSSVKDTGFTHSTVTNNSRIEVDEDGNYSIYGAILYQGTTANYRFTSEVTIRVNGTTTLTEKFTGGYLRATSGANYNQVSFSTNIALTAGDYVEILSKRVSTTSGNATVLSGTNVSMVFLKGTKGDTGPTGPTGPAGPSGLSDAIQTVAGDTGSFTATGADTVNIVGGTNISTSVSGDIVTIGFTGTIITDHGALSGLSDDDHTQYHTDARALTWLGTRSSSDLPEGTNLYYTAERVDDQVNTLLTAGTNITLTYDDGAGTLTIDAAGGGSAAGSDTQIQYNDSGSFGASSDFTWNDTTKNLSVSGISNYYNVGSNSVFLAGAGNTTATSQFSIGIGDKALRSLTTGAFNIGIGEEALQAVTNGQWNTAMGANAGRVYTGSQGVFIGLNSGIGLTTGPNVFAMGTNALGGAGASSNAIGIGVDAGRFPTTSRSVYIGDRSGRGVAASTNTLNIGIGYDSLYGVTSGSQNIAIGPSSLSSLTTGANNTAIGYQAGLNLTTGSDNTFIGTTSGATGVVTGSSNVGIGTDASKSITSGASNIGIGKKALFSVTTGNRNVGIGESAGELNNNATGQNTFVGYFAGYANTGQWNTMLGFQAGRNNTGSSNVYIGQAASQSNVNGANNISIGASSNVLATTGSFNISIGTETHRSYTGANSIAIGYQAGYSVTTGSSGIYLGYRAGLFTTTGALNTFIGVESGRSVATGGFNTAVGSNTMSLAGTAAANNAAVGYFALRNVTGTGNTAVGFQAGLDVTSGASNTFIGYDADVGDPTHSNVVSIGRGATSTTSNELTIGSTTYPINSMRLGVQSSGNPLVTADATNLAFKGQTIGIATTKTPASASDTGTTGMICWDADYLYVCTATDTWKRTALTTW
jgi:hypothetical protein